MRYWKTALAMGAAPAAFLALAIGLYAQPVGQAALNGNECWNAGQGPGGPSVGALCSQVVNGRIASMALTIAGNFTVGTTSANTTPGSTASIDAGGYMLVTAQPSAATITLPAAPVSDGAVIAFCNVTNGAFATNAVTYAANSNQTLATGVPAMTTQAARTCNKVIYNAAAATWYGVQ